MSGNSKQHYNRCQKSCTYEGGKATPATRQHSRARMRDRPNKLCLQRGRFFAGSVAALPALPGAELNLNVSNITIVAGVAEPCARA